PVEGMGASRAAAHESHAAHFPSLRHADLLAAAAAHALLFACRALALAHRSAYAHGAPHPHRYYLSQPFSEMSKMTPSGSLNFTSKFASSFDFPRVKKNLPPAASMRFFVASTSSTWKPKW